MLPEQHSSALDFSVSHAGDLSVIAISRLGPASMDIERRRQVSEIAQIAADVFDQRTAANLNSLPASCRSTSFLRLWTAGEACLKATGLGFAGAGGRAPVKLVPNAWPQIEIDQLVNRTDRYPLSLHALDLPPDYVGNLVIQNRALDDLCHLHANPTPTYSIPLLLNSSMDSSSSSEFGGGIAIVGMSCLLPGGVDSLESMWELLCNARDAISEVPSDRWKVDTFYDPNPGVPGKTVTRWGGFVDNIAAFDAAFFRLQGA